MPMDEDLDVFFDDDDFAIAATLNGTASGNVIVDRGYLRAVGMVDTTDPVAMAQAADYAASAVDGTLAVGGTSYVIRSRQVQDDGNLVILQLEST